MMVVATVRMIYLCVIVRSTSPLVHFHVFDDVRVASLCSTITVLIPVLRICVVEFRHIVESNH